MLLLLLLLRPPALQSLVCLLLLLLPLSPRLALLAPHRLALLRLEVLLAQAPLGRRGGRLLLVQLPVGRARSMGIHESQSLSFEMQLARSRAFSGLLTPLLVKTVSSAGRDSPAMPPVAAMP